MRKLFFIGLLSFGSLFYAQEDIKEEEPAEAVKGTEYGAGVSENITYDVYDTTKLISSLREKKELNDIVVRGKVTAVCQVRGCWITLQNSENIRIFIKMKDYAFFLPKSIVGKTVLLHTNAKLTETSVKELRHYAKDAGKSKAEIEKITEPKTEIRLLASGIKVID